MKQYRFHCPNCGQRYAATPEKAGTATQCSTCKVDMMVPLAPSPLKVGFAKEVLPALLFETPSILISAAHTGEGFRALKTAWDEYAQDECAPDDYFAPDDLKVEVLRAEGSLTLVFELPKAYRESEAFYATATLVPPQGQKLTHETVRHASKHFFLLSLYGGKTFFEESVGGKIKSRGRGTPPDDRDTFVSWAQQQCGLSGLRPSPDITDVAPERLHSAAALAEARSTLNSALQRFLNGEYETFSVKVPIVEGEMKEDLWLGDLKYYSDGTFSGIIEDRPKIVQTIVQGQSCEVAYDDVKDWQSFHQGKIHGNYSLRAIIPELSSEEAAKYRAVLADLP